MISSVCEGIPGRRGRRHAFDAEHYDGRYRRKNHPRRHVRPLVSLVVFILIYRSFWLILPTRIRLSRSAELAI